MKNKATLVFVLALMVNSMVFGQFRLGIRGGLNSVKMKSNTVITAGNYKITCPDYAMLGYHVGLINQIQLFNFFIQPEVLYTVTRNDLNVYDLSSSAPDHGVTALQKLNRIDVPVMLGFKIKVLKIEAGPVATFLISDNSDLKRITTYDLRLNRSTIGYQAGAGLDIGRIAFDVKYEGSLSKVGKGIKAGGEYFDFDSRLNQIIFSLGLFF